MSECGGGLSAVGAAEMSLPQHMTRLFGKPTPRTHSVASAVLASASPTVLLLMTGVSEFGMTCVNIVRTFDSPRASDAMTKSDCLTLSTSDLRMRAVPGQEKN